MLTLSLKPNKIIIQDAYTTNTAWHVVATDGTGHATIAALLAAGKTLYPNVLPGGFGTLVARSIATGGVTDGGLFFITTNLAAAPANDLTAVPISGSGQNLVFSDQYLNNVWVRKPTNTDLVYLEFYY